MTITGMFANIPENRVYPAKITLSGDHLVSIEEVEAKGVDPGFIIPGFIDAHVHIESSMLVPSEFARLAVVHGTVATVSDPHEIANVLGIPGIDFMIQNGRSVPFKFNFGAPSCVPASRFETSGAIITPSDVEKLLDREEIKYLSEMMNFPGVLNGDKDVMEKISAARDRRKPIDGHAPGLTGRNAQTYIEAGISTDHECFTYEEAHWKLQCGMKIIIREGSAAKNFDALIDLLRKYPNHIMFCSDDKHPDSLVEGHINVLCARARKKGIDLFSILKAACVNPKVHYNLDVGQLLPGDPGDFIIVEDLESFRVMKTFINGKLVAENGKAIWPKQQVHSRINNFRCARKTIQDLAFPATASMPPAIEAIDGQLITKKAEAQPLHSDGLWLSDPGSDTLKLVVVNRYGQGVAKAFVKNFNLKKGAIASSVAHDSHNIVAVGADDNSLLQAINLVIQHQGGISCVNGVNEKVLPLPIGGLMSDREGEEVANDYIAIDVMAKSLGSTLSSPFMTLSFMSLLVIPHLKLSDRGLFDGDAFRLL